MTQSPSPSPSQTQKADRLSVFFRPVDAASLVWVRVCFGLIMLWEVVRYSLAGRISRYYIEPEYLFSYYGFAWVRPWPGTGMYLHFAMLGALAAMMAAGLLYRVSAALFFVGFSYVFLLDQSHYLNHLYLVCLLSFLLILLPVNRLLSADAVLGLSRPAQHVPAWALRLLQVQVGMVYFWGGVAKLNGDWLRAQPLLDWMENRRDTPLFGPLLAWDPTAWFMSYAGMLLDLLVVPALLWKKSRPYAILFAFSFHLLNNFLFNIGIFPWMMMALTLLFLEPDWPRRLLRLPAADLPPAPTQTSRSQRLLLAGLALYLAVQVALPLRHWLYPGEVSWTEEGHNFSWHMKLRSKSAKLQYKLHDPDSNERWTVDPAEHLSERQARKMATRPDMILLYAHHLAEQARSEGHPNVRVYARSRAALNGRAYQPLIYERVDLTQVERKIWPPAKWIVPLREPLLDPE